MRRVRNLTATVQLEHVMIGSRVHVPIGASERFIEANKRAGQWQGGTTDQDCDGSKIVAYPRSCGASEAGAASAALARATAKKRRSHSLNGSKSEGGAMAPVIQLRRS